MRFPCQLEGHSMLLLVEDDQATDRRTRRMRVAHHRFAGPPVCDATPDSECPRPRCAHGKQCAALADSVATACQQLGMAVKYGLA